MILSGWILPDLYEVKCKSCSTLNGHIEVVKRYLENLKQKNITAYDKIMNEFNQLKLLHTYLSLDDFAVMRLGWIKINNDPINIIFYTEENELEFLVLKYINFGYFPVVLEKNKTVFTLNIPSEQLI